MNKAPELEGEARRGAGAFVLALLLLVAPNAFAWNDTGHLIAAMIAYDALSPAARDWAVEVIRAHPRFREDFEARLPASLADAAAPERARWYFGRAAVWPDYARRFDGASAAARDGLIARYNHASWHYVNLPLYLSSLDAQRDPQPAPRLEWEAGLDPSRLNVVQALSMETADWCKAAPPDRAVALSWLLHLMADLHQPLHTTAMFGAPAFERGDRGGNDVPVAGGGNLHELWDAALGSERRFGRIVAAAQAAARAIAPPPGDVAVVDPPRDFALWAADGRDLAAGVVYTDAVRDAMSSSRPGALRTVVVTDSYRNAMRAESRRRIVLAGRRTAALLERLRTRDRHSDCRG